MLKQWRVSILAVSAVVLLLACTIGPPAPPAPGGTTPPVAPGGNAGGLAGGWRVYSSRLFYDSGGGGTLGGQVYQSLELTSGGGWAYGSSSGSWSVVSIDAADWSRWGIGAYGPTRKIVLEGWNGTTADGPLEEEGGTVNFLWVLYRTGPPTASAPGTVHMKFGH